MNISIKPVFSFSLNYKIFEKLVTCGKYDGIHSCLTVVTNADKILIHTPHKRYGLQNSKLSISEIKNDIAMLNMNFSIRGIIAGKMKSDDERDVLVIGGSSNFLGVIKGFNADGDEIIWLITPGGVNCMMLMDIDKDGQNELIVGTDEGCIKIYKKDALLHEFTEGSEIQNLIMVNQNQFMYSVKNGTIGFFDESVRLWRIKSKTRVTAMALYDILGCERKQVIVGWKGGKIDVRDSQNGDVLFKMKLNDVVCGIACNDYRGIGVLDIVIVTADGEIRGYTTPTVNLLNLHNLADEEMNNLLTQKQKLLLELKHYENNQKLNKEILATNDSQAVNSIPENVGVIPSNTRLQIGISTSYDSTDMNIDITVSTNNATSIRAVLIFADQLFKEETLIAHLTKDVSRILIPLKTLKDNAQDIHIKAFVGYPNSVQFHVFELTRQLPKFAMYTIPHNLTGSPKSIAYINGLATQDTFGDSYVEFRITERLSRICIWINQNFLLPSDIEYMTSFDAETTELKLNLISLRTGKNVCLHFNNDGKTRFYTDDIGLAGDLIQSLVQFLNIENMNSTACFPSVYEEIRQMFSKLQGLQETEKQINSEIIDNINQVKSHIIRAEDARYYNGDAVVKYHNEIMNTNKDLVKNYKIRLVNTGEVQLVLKRIHSILYNASKLRVGSFAASIIGKFKDALKNNNIEAVLKIIELGEI
ncbi:Bardet-Biedl syndrome 2 protein homolog isoform X2 [Toxorhynchites rutilus septentrionalis]|uniref:Bardet-Biedl syndrome 2 protein homolog isoform X2 n=1 Tax=Toxorhynchites rutilus septentrionalis TaxID=329112 RepID=UPI002478670A|nr:Bardet-Biedl syndrome 2 protein homolog isoform X2 [Toxorhynchites rutilus septentrionalis]